MTILAEFFACGFYSVVEHFALLLVYDRRAIAVKVSRKVVPERAFIGSDILALPNFRNVFVLATL